MSIPIGTLLAMSPFEALVAMLNDANSLQGGETLIPSLVSFGAPSVVNGAITQITLTANPPTGFVNGSATNFFVGNETFLYNRISLADFFVAPEDLNIPFNTPADTYSILNVWQAKYGFNDAGGDFSIEQIGLGASIVTVRADPNSLRWYGSVDVTIVSPLPSIGTSIENPILTGIPYPTPLL